jgi:hypothetical protein
MHIRRPVGRNRHVATGIDPNTPDAPEAAIRLNVMQGLETGLRSLLRIHRQNRSPAPPATKEKKWDKEYPIGGTHPLH